MSEGGESYIKEINEYSNEYREYKTRRENELNLTPGAYIFGSDIVDRLDELEKTEPDYRARCSNILLPLRAQLTHIQHEHRYARPYIEEFLGGEYKQGNSDLSDIALEMRLREHVEKMKDEQERFNKEKTVLVKDYVGNLTDYLASEGVCLPHNIVASRLAFTKFFLSDPLLVEDVEKNKKVRGEKITAQKENSWLGKYLMSPQAVLVKAPIQYSHEIRGTLGHEVNHVLAGRSILEATKDSGEKKVFLLRNGFRSVYDDEGRNVGYGEQWLDEAVTEQLMLNVYNQESKSYEDERDLLHLLRKKGKREIPMNLFLAAYFENDDPSKDADTRMENYGKLLRAISESYDRNLFRTLNQYVERYGIKNAVEVFSEDWQNFNISETDKTAA